MDGLPGQKGENGLKGLPGFSGQKGIAGRPGPPGFSGLKGNKGAPGRIGTPGKDGFPGAKGNRGLDGTKVLDSFQIYTLRIVLFVKRFLHQKSYLNNKLIGRQRLTRITWSCRGERKQWCKRSFRSSRSTRC